MNQIQDYKSKVSDGSSKVKFDLWTLVLAAVRLAGRYGIPAVSVLIAIAYVAVRMGAANVARAAIIAMAPIVFFVGLYIAVKEEVDA